VLSLRSDGPFCHGTRSPDLHTRHLLKAMPIDKVTLVSVWEEVSHLFTGIYRAALTSAADVTRVSETHASDEAYAAASAAFEPNDLVDLTVRMTAPGASGTSASNRGR
jgi:alkylhydroperoxidase family enzyme